MDLPRWKIEAKGEARFRDGKMGNGQEQGGKEGMGLWRVAHRGADDPVVGGGPQ